jgi:drug/metabolite transporter (DMT)-like permease
MTHGSFGSVSARDPRTGGTAGIDGFAIAAILTCLLGIVPIALGFVSLRRIRRTGQGGTVLAYVAIGLGVLSGLFVMAFYVAILSVAPELSAS